jgi:hypothetical protein
MFIIVVSILWRESETEGEIWNYVYVSDVLFEKHSSRV